MGDIKSGDINTEISGSSFPAEADQKIAERTEITLPNILGGLNSPDMKTSLYQENKGLSWVSGSIMDTQRTINAHKPNQKQTFTHRQSTKNTDTHQPRFQARENTQRWGSQKYETSHTDRDRDRDRENIVVTEKDKTNFFKKITLQKQNRTLLLGAVFVFFLGLSLIIASASLAAFTGLGAAIITGVGIGATVAAVTFFAIKSYQVASSSKMERASISSKKTSITPKPTQRFTKLPPNNQEDTTGLGSKFTGETAEKKGASSSTMERASISSKKTSVTPSKPTQRFRKLPPNPVNSDERLKRLSNKRYKRLRESTPTPINSHKRLQKIYREHLQKIRKEQKQSAETSPPTPSNQDL